MKSIRSLYKIGRGPSSSHTIGPERAARQFRQAHPDAEAFRVTLYESLCKTGKGHGTDRVLYEVLAPLPTEVIFCEETPSDVTHPNTMDFAALRGGFSVTCFQLHGGACPRYAHPARPRIARCR